MALILRFIDHRTNLLIADLTVSQCSVSYGLNKSGEWSTQIPAASEPAQSITEGNIVEIYFQGRLMMRGTVQQPSLRLQDQGTYALKGRDTLDDLANARAHSRGLYKNTLLVTALADLLYQAGWRLGDISTLPDALTTVITEDVRSEKQLASQISKLLEHVPKLAYRYGGVQAGYPTLDIGYFLQDSGIKLYTPLGDSDVINEHFDNIISAADTIGFIKSLSFSFSLDTVVWGMEAVGGEVTDNTGNKRSISLYDAVLDNPAAPTDPDYPIIEQLPKQTYFVFDKSRCKYPGGGVQYWDPGAEANNVFFAGNPDSTSAGRNQKHAVWFYPMPGKLEDLFIESASGSALGTITEPLMWWLCAGGGYPTPGAVLASGTLNGGVYVSSARLRADIPEDQKIIFEPNTEYVLVVGYEKVGGYPVSTFRRLRSINATPTALTQRMSTSINNGTSWSSNSNMLPFALITRPIDLPLGGTTLESVTEIAPDRDENNATLADVKAAGRQLWQYCKAFLQDHSGDRVDYDLNVLGEIDLPPLGSTVYVRGQAEGTYIDPYTGDEQIYHTLVERDLRVNQIDLNFSSDRLEISMKLAEGTGLTVLDEYSQIYDVAKKSTPTVGALRTGLLQPNTSSQTGMVYGNLDVNAALANGKAAVEITLPYPTPPSTFVNVPILAGTPFGTSARGTVYVEVVSHPDRFTSTGAVIRVAVGAGWRFDDSVSLNAMYIWY